MRFRGTQGEDQDHPNGSLFGDAFRFNPSSWMNALQSIWPQWGSRRQRHSLALWRPDCRFYARDSALATPLATYRFARRLGKESQAASSLPSPATADCNWSLRTLRYRGMHGAAFRKASRSKSPPVCRSWSVRCSSTWTMRGLYVADSSGPNADMQQQLAKGRTVIRWLEDGDVDGHSDGDGMAGNCLDDVFIERSWRSLKYEAVCLAG